jgi:solute:Na+ symporter, SSS family
MRKFLYPVFILIFFSNIIYANDIFTWTELPEIPPLPGQLNQPGLAGAFAGVDNDALILAGGTNFPDGLPWNQLADGSYPEKIYHREIYVLQKNGQWTVADKKLPKGYSYGVTIPTDFGLVCIGGEWQEFQIDGTHNFKSDKVFIINHLGDGAVKLDDKSFPVLPEPVSAMAGAKIGDYIYITGGNNGKTETKNFWRIDISKRNQWEKLEPWPGEPRSYHIVVAQSDGRKNCLYIFSGRYNDPQKGWQFLKDSYKYDPDSGVWTKVADVGTNLSNKQSVCVMAAAGIKLGANHIAIFGGASGELFQQVEQDIPKQIQMLESVGKMDEARALTAEKWMLYTKHPGFSRKILVYHTITDTWVQMGSVPESQIEGRTAGSHVTTAAVHWDKNIIIPGGEVRPGVRSPKVWSATPVIQSRFGAINYIVVGLYLSLLVVMGFYFSKRENTTEDFFKAGGRIPWWAAGLSIFGTQLSAITFMAIPAKSFATDWTWFMMNMTIIAVAPLIVLLFLPFYRRLNVTTAYEYIERRFNIVLRLTASAMFMLFQFARIGIVLYLPSIALSVVTGIDIRTCILVMGVLSIVYTVMGGIEAVIWTDVIQVIVLLSGALLVLIMIPYNVPDGVEGMIKISMDAEKLRVFDFHFSFKSPTLWVLILGGIGANLISYGSDQSVVQRYLTTKSEKDAARGIWTNGILTIPASIIFFGLGTALFAFFKSHPENLNATIQMTDAIFPWYIISQLPAGIAGLLIAGIFAAAMSSLDSSMNSVATAYTTDFYRRFKPNVEDQKCLTVARIVTVVVGLSGIVFALIMATWDIQSLWSEFMKYIGLFGGGLGGLFILAIFTRRANSRGALIGLIASAIIQYTLQSSGMVHGVMFAATGMISCFAIGYLASLVMGSKDKDLTGLTMYSLKKSN